MMKTVQSVNHNGAISVVKFSFCIIIVMMHYSVPASFSEYMFEGGYIYVDFFFILQGFYLLKKWGCENGKNAYNVAVDYLMNRLNRFFPCVFASAFFLLLLQISTGCSDIKFLAKSVLAFLWQISFVSQLFDFMSLERGGIFWFLSASVIIGTFLVWLCSILGKTVYIIAVLAVSFIANYLYINIGNLDIWWSLFTNVPVRASLIRAFMDILIGIIARNIFEYFKRFKKGQCIRFMEIVVSMLISIGSVIIVLYMPHGKADFFLILAFGVLLIALSDAMPRSGGNVTSLLDKMCMPMYVFQVCSIFFVDIMVTPEEKNYMGLVLTLVIDVGASIIWVKYFSQMRLDYLVKKYGG